MIKAVLFDLDDTLRSFMITKGIACEAAIDAMIESGLKMERNNALDKLFELYRKYGIEDKMIFQRFLKNVNGNLDYKIIAAGIVAYREAAEKRNRPITGIVPMLNALKKRRLTLGIVSNAPSLKAWLRLTESGMRDYFDFVIAFDDAGKKKPHPKPFDMAIRKMPFEPEEILFVGDDLKRDIAGAKMLGLRTALADYETKHSAASIGKYKPDFILSKPSDVMKIIRCRN